MARIALIEDDLDLREGLADLLRAVGHDVREFEHGLAALRGLTAPDGEVDLILLDLMMPVMNGWEFRAEQLEDARLAAIPVVIISGAGQLEAEAEALDAAATLQKPFDASELTQVVEGLAPT